MESSISSSTRDLGNFLISPHLQRLILLLIAIANLVASYLTGRRPDCAPIVPATKH